MTATSSEQEVRLILRIRLILEIPARQRSVQLVSLSDGRFSTAVLLAGFQRGTRTTERTWQLLTGAATTPQRGAVLKSANFQNGEVFFKVGRNHKIEGGTHGGETF